MKTQPNFFLLLCIIILNIFVTISLPFAHSSISIVLSHIIKLSINLVLCTAFNDYSGVRSHICNKHTRSDVLLSTAKVPWCLQLLQRSRETCIALKRHL